MKNTNPSYLHTSQDRKTRLNFVLSGTQKLCKLDTRRNAASLGQRGMQEQKPDILLNA